MPWPLIPRRAHNPASCPGAGSDGDKAPTACSAVGPLMSSYLDRLETALSDMGVRAPLQIMQSNGGVMSASAVATKPIQSIESGPAAGRSA